MEKVFDKFTEIFTERCERIPLLHIGEDSVRYDFFIALSNVENLKPWDIQIEHAFNDNSFIWRNQKTVRGLPPLKALKKTTNAKRDEKPLLDLVVDKESLKLCAEFALFRQNSNENGIINQTARTVKMINDIIRLGNDSFYTGRQAYFVCVADEKMIGHQLRSKTLGKFPTHYQISMEVVKEQQKTKTSNFDKRFLNKFEELNCCYYSKLLHTREIKAKKINKTTLALTWEVTKM